MAEVEGVCSRPHGNNSSSVMSHSSSVMKRTEENERKVVF